MSKGAALPNHRPRENPHCGVVTPCENFGFGTSWLAPILARGINPA